LELGRADLVNIASISERQAHNIVAQFASAKQASFVTWLAALGVTGLSQAVNQYNWQDLLLWSIDEWQINAKVSLSKAKQYQQFVRSEQLANLQKTLAKEGINGFF